MKVKVRHEGVFLGGIRNVDAFDGALVGELVDGGCTSGASSNGAIARPTS